MTLPTEYHFTNINNFQVDKKFNFYNKKKLTILFYLFNFLFVGIFVNLLYKDKRV